MTDNVLPGTNDPPTSLSASNMDEAFMAEFMRRIKEPAPIPKTEEFKKLEEAAIQRR